MSHPFQTDHQRPPGGLLEGIHPNGRRRGPELDRESAALLLIDLQRYFVDPASHACIPGAAALEEPLGRLAEGFRCAGRPVILTRHVDPPGVSPMRSWWNDALDEGDPRAELAWPALAQQGAVLTKPHYDAFLDTDLESTLRAAGVRHLVLAGVATHLCVESTARSAFCRGFHVTLAADGCTSFREDLHRAALLTLSHGLARVMTVDELLQALR